MTLSQIITLLLGTMVIGATLLPLLRSGQWWIRVLDFPRLQIATLAVLSLAGMGLSFQRDTVWQWGFVTLVTLCLIFQIRQILPYTRLARRQVLDAGASPGPAIRLLLGNVLITNRHHQKYVELVRHWNPDLVLAVEPDASWERALAVLEGDYPYVVKRALDNAYGILLYARVPLLAPEIRYLIQDDVPSIHTRVLLGDHPVALHFIHPRPPAPQENNESTERDAELVMVAKEVQREGLPAIVAGDLNDVAWSHTTGLFQRISRMLDPRVGRGMYNTFHARYPFFRWPLDHVFHTDHFTLKRLVRLPDFGSDHFAIYVELALTPEKRDQQKAPALEPEHEAEADQKVAEALERREEGRD